MVKRKRTPPITHDYVQPTFEEQLRWFGREALDDCVICREEFAKFPEVVGKCKHGLHQECWNDWAKTGATTCPTCRADWKDLVDGVDEGSEGDDE